MSRLNRHFRVPRLILLILAVVLSATGQPAAISDSARQQIRELQQEKASRSALHRKLDSQFVYQLKQNRGQTIAPSATRFRPDLKFAADGRVLVDIDAEVSDTLLDQIRSGGGDIISSVPRFAAIRALVPLALVETIAGNTEVKFVRRAVPAMTRAGSVNSEGDTTHAAATARTNFAVNGTGVRVGVLSDSVDYLSDSQTSGELPAVTVLSGQDGTPGSGEGTAMLEIVHDLAPGAQLAFATAFTSEASFAQNILNLRTNGCDIIVDDVAYYDESPFQDGIVAQAVNTVTADGALYFSSAGNGGNKNDNFSATWEGDFADGGAVTSPIPDTTGRVHSFGAANYNTVVGVSSVPVVLFWADPWGASANDYDLYVLNSAGTSVLASSGDPQSGTQNPWEYINAASVSNRIVVVKYSGTNRFLHLQLMSNGEGTLGSSTAGSIAGHCAAANAYAVAATRANYSYPNPFTGGGANPVEYFSSDGLRHMFYKPDGTPFTPGNFSSSGGIVLQKPDITAANGGSTSVPGFETFYGTSAAAPHAAAIAALLLSYNPDLTPAEVRSTLTNTALDIEAAGTDRDSGAGIIMAQAALASLPSVIFTGTALLAETCVNNAIDPGETVTLNVTLKNLGPSPTTNLVATLLATNGVTAPDGAKNYGPLPVDGSGSHTFAFTASGVCGSNITARLQLQDGPRNLGTISKSFMLGAANLATTAFTNSAAITLPTVGAASPFPSTISVSNLVGTVSKITLTLRGVTHNNPDDIDAFLVGPGGQSVLIMSDCGGSPNLSGVNITLDDSAIASLPNSTALTTGTYKPANYGSGDTFSSPAPAGSYGSALADFQNTNPNGTWSLYVQDDNSSMGGSLASGWTLTIITSNLTCCVAAPPAANLALGQTVSPAGTNVGGQVTFTLNVTNLGPNTATNVVVTNTLPAGLNFISATPAAGFTNGNVLTFALGNLTNGGKTNITIQAAAATAGARTNTAAISSATADPTNANNSASAVVTINAFPVISAIANVTNNEDTVAGPIAFTVSDAETTASALTLTASSSNTNLITTNHIGFSGSGTNRTVTLTPSTNQSGSATIILTVSDGLAAASNSFLYVVNPVNDAPVLTAISNRTNTELTTLTFTNTASDSDLPTNILAFSLGSGAPSNANVNATSGVFSWTPTEAHGPSTHPISVIVTDNGSPSMSATQSFAVIVLETNSPPVLNTNADQTIYEGETLTLTNTASDSDLPTNTLAFSFGSGAPSNATLNAASGVFSWTPTLTQGPSTNPITIIVNDSGSPSLSATQSFSVVVLDTNPPPSTFTISGSVESQSFAGTNRAVRFIVSEVSDGSTNYLQTNNVVFTNGVTTYNLQVPTNTTHLSAKTAWNLRRRLPVTFAGATATVNFTGAANLKGGDIVTVSGGTIDDTDNAVTSPDYLLLLANFLQTVGGDADIGRADVDGDGTITSADYLNLLGNYLQQGDPP